MKTETFFSYRKYRWFWVNLIVLVGLVIVYLQDSPIGGRNGATAVGYTYGSLATAGILYLMWFGIRKRSYSSKYTTLKGCLSAHVWLGIALVIIVPLHAGFHFGVNVHTLAYALMMIVVLSGIWGALRYEELAPQILSHRGSAPIKKLIEQQLLLSNEIGALSSQKSDAFLKLADKIDFTFVPSITASFLSVRPRPIATAEGAELLAALPAGEQDDGVKLIALANRKRDVVTALLNEARTLNRLKIWLFIHVPISCALLAAVAIHIFSVFYYH